MRDESPGFTRDALLREADRLKLGVTGDKLDRWVRRGLVRRPATQNFGGRVGKQALYPAGTVEQLAAVAEALAVDRRLAPAGFLVWWWGFDVDLKEVRRFLSKVAVDLDNEISELRVAHENGTVDQLIDDSSSARVKNRVMRRARRRVGSDSFPTVIRILIEIATGTFSGLHTDYATDEDEGLLFEKALGLARARTDVLPDGSEPWLTSSPEENLREISLVMSQGLTDVLKATGDSELVEARIDAVPIAEVLAALAPFLEAEKGKDAYGMTEFGRTLGEMSIKDLGQFFLMWLKLRTLPVLQPGIAELCQTARDVMSQVTDEENPS